MDRYTKNNCTLQVRNVIDSLHDIREDKVKDFKRKIQKNLYRPDPDEIADRMIEESLQEILWQMGNLN
jgi:anti-sigma28 factor (negative regulator of flagellin synthesis)